MGKSVKDAGMLFGERVAFTGKLATMPRSRAMRLVRDCGGECSTSVNRRTTILVIGQDGWPFRADGRLSHKLQRAKSLKAPHSITILNETAFFERLGADINAEQLSGLSIARLSALLKVPGNRVQQWIDWGLIAPSETVHGVHYFDFREVSWAKTLCDLLARGIAVDRLRRSIRQLQHLVPEAGGSLARLNLLEKHGRILVRLQDQLVEPSGQRTLDFGDDGQAPSTVPLATGPQTAEEWFELGFQKESFGEHAAAEQAYRQALRVGGPNPETCFNLANVLYALDKKAQAAERYRQVVELDRNHADAWNNLGKVLEEAGEKDEAIAAYEASLRIEPCGLDARFNLADLLDETGQRDAAKVHWQAYLRIEQVGAWAEYARRRLA